MRTWNTMGEEEREDMVRALQDERVALEFAERCEKGLVLLDDVARTPSPSRWLTHPACLDARGP